MVWLLLGWACGRIDRALPNVFIASELLEAVVKCADQPDPLGAAFVIVDGWIDVRDHMRRTRARQGGY
jgi:hypothetical protein